MFDGIITAEIQGMKAEMQGMKAEIQGIKAEMQGMKTEMQGMKTEMQGMKIEMRAEVQDIKNIINSAAVKLLQKIDESKCICK